MRGLYGRFAPSYSKSDSARLDRDDLQHFFAALDPRKSVNWVS
jgi:hypothetical protein